MNPNFREHTQNQTLISKFSGESHKQQDRNKQKVIPYCYYFLVKSEKYDQYKNLSSLSITVY